MQFVFDKAFLSSIDFNVLVAWLISLTAGTILLIVIVLKDMWHSEVLSKKEDDLAALNQKLLALGETKEDQSMIIAHQIRTPLTAIKGYASMLAEGDYGKLGPAQIEVINTIFQSSEHLIHLTSSILDSGTLESGMGVDFGNVNLRDMVTDVLRELKPKAEKKKLYVYFDQVNHEIPVISGDENKIRQAILNIIDNAIKYTPAGGITVRMIADSKGVRLSVTDTGIGVRPEDQRKLFDKFFQSSVASEWSEKGAGMGMYIAKKIAEAHGGTVWVESEGSNKGSTFHLWLPLSGKSSSMGDIGKQIPAIQNTITNIKVNDKSKIEAKKPVAKKSPVKKTTKMMGKTRVSRSK
jgi:signal transduction histidine kinase